MYICVIAVLAISILTGCSTSTRATTTAAQTEAATIDTVKAETEKEKAAGTAEASEKAQDTTSKEVAATADRHHIKVNVKDYGTISMELYGDETPITMANFLGLTRDGSYNRLTFHRIISGFMIQGGDPLSTDMGGSDQEIKGELSNNGVENPLSRVREAISMARSRVKDSVSSQFFIVHEGSTFLDGDYACFGYVIEGMGVVDTVCEDTKVEDNNGSVAKDNQLVIKSAEVMD